LPEIVIRKKVWQDFVSVARRQRRTAAKLAEKVLRDYVQRTADEELLAESERAARRTGLKASDAEELVRQYRHRAAKEPR
jgi:hypothetical protein